jgi:hypothetical protein
VDDCFITGPEIEVTKFKEELMSAVDCDDGGEINEYVGCRINYDRRNKTIKVTQPVLLQSFQDEFNISGSEKPKSPGLPLKALQLGSEPPVEGDRRTYYRSGVGKLMHLKRWSRPDMANAVRDLARHYTNGTEEHVDAMHRAMRYAVATPERGLKLSPIGNWNGNPEWLFEIKGYADASYKTYQDKTTSVGGHVVFLQNAPIAEKSRVQQSTTLSVTEAELVSGTDCAQDMLYAMRIMESIGLMCSGLNGILNTRLDLFDISV